VDCWTGSCEVKVQPLCAAGLLVSLVPLNLLFFYCSMLEYVCVRARGWTPGGWSWTAVLLLLVNCCLFSFEFERTITYMCCTVVLCCIAL
jgi:hypothetical protein